MPPSKTTKKTTTRKTASSGQSAQSQPISQPVDPNDKYAPNTWLNGGVGSMEDLTVPSGQVCLVRRPGVEGLLAEGVLHNIDSLTAIVDRTHVKKTKKGKAEQIDVNSIMKDPKAITDIMHTVDRVVSHCVVKPEVHMTPNDVTNRKPGVVYCDMVDMNDRMFIFNYVVGGTRDAERFREGAEDALGGVDAGEGVQEDAR